MLYYLSIYMYKSLNNNRLDIRTDEQFNTFKFILNYCNVFIYLFESKVISNDVLPVHRVCQLFDSCCRLVVMNVCTNI